LADGSIETGQRRFRIGHLLHADNHIHLVSFPPNCELYIHR
jgi:hypothetical protein